MTRKEILKKVKETTPAEICSILAQKEYGFITSKEIIQLLQEKYERMPVEMLKDLYLGNLCLGSKKLVTWEENEDEGDW